MAYYNKHNITIISIHAPRGGSDDAVLQNFTTTDEFQSTLPAGGATADFEWLLHDFIISIHAPRGGSDLRTLTPP